VETQLLIKKSKSQKTYRAVKKHRCFAADLALEIKGFKLLRKPVHSLLFRGSHGKTGSQQMVFPQDRPHNLPSKHVVVDACFP